jgi:hypothetical protein
MTTPIAAGPNDVTVSGWRWLLWKVFGRHKWGYYNPYDRTCKVCGRREVSHCASLDSWNKSWGETWDEGDERKHYEASNASLSGLPLGKD